MNKDIWRASVAELVGTFALVFIGAGAVCANDWTAGKVGILGIALAHGLVLMAMIYAVGHISGTHINPAVTIAFMSQRRIEPVKGLFYILAQLSGAVLAGFFLRVIFPAQVETVFLGTTILSVGVSPTAGLLMELILTFLLVFTIFGAGIDERSPKGFAGLAIGLVLTFDILIGGALTGASMNPARTFGPALVANHWAWHWIYWVGPILGGLFAAFLYQGILAEKKG